MNINEFTEDEDKVYCDKINDDFIYFLNAIPDIEISEVNDGRTLKLRSSINDNGDVSFGDIFFELQWMLHRFKEKNPDFIVDKMLVSKLMLTSKSIAKELNVRRGFLITVRYQSHPSIKAPLSN
jgi:hypothetical protein